ncbi:hypothetical protein PLESTB_000573200 [Pleodorina starrii]|uniref:DAGKc domain-containing protein n=1 Tax=Pleodorina starrii TaxID=330485 RepID=A0A9W6BGY4_9CHLO|nr:hypothetical protein PLESTM_000311500 [Pleodorina starrii]GLC52016.1 hypothetical protein PLESTB_000573200 [Pleodorina starrii]GLC72156.1 hypothetical protein PLESTF_001213000 [Pleodorina starrii]
MKGPRHKRQGSDCDVQAPWIDTSNLTSTDQPIVSPIAANCSFVSSTRTGKASEQQRTAVSRENSQSPTNSGLAQPLGGGDDGAPALKDPFLSFRGTKVKVKLTPTHFSWKAVNPVGGCCVDRRSLAKAVAIDEILSAAVLKPGCCPREHTFVIYSFSRKAPRNPNTWRLEQYLLSTANPETAREWVAAISARVDAIRDRPRNLLVFINPYAGSRLARLTWEREVQPVFQRAKITVNAVETTKQDHARDMLELMKADDLASYQGVVAVGGDGLFQEVVSGLLARRSRGDPTATRIRVGHVPAGSTDAVAYTLHGSRCATTAALHIALGDKLSLDCGRVDAADGSCRHFVCQAGYGFMGDVMRFSERLRFMGPGRYDITGALQFLRLASYRVQVSYREAPSTTADVQQLCTAQCEVCRMAGIRIQTSYHQHQHQHPHRASPNGAAGGGGGKVGGVSPRASGAAAGSVPVSGASSGSGAGLFRYSPPPVVGVGSATADSNPSSMQLGTQAGSGVGAGGAGMPLSGFAAYDGPAPGGGGGGNSGPLVRTSPSPLPGQSSLTATAVERPMGHGSSPASLVDPPAPEAAADGAGGGFAAGTLLDATAKPVAVGAFATATAAAASAAAAACGGGCTDRPVPRSFGAKEGGVGWTSVEGEFVSIMCVVTPCRSDKSKRGIIPNGHLSDGRMYLVLVSRCSHLDFLRFLLRLSTRGLTDRCLPFVRVIPITGLKLTPAPGGHRLGGCIFDAAAPESVWNVDGELLSNNEVAMSVTRGALEVFARGVETAQGSA